MILIIPRDLSVMLALDIPPFMVAIALPSFLRVNFSPEVLNPPLSRVMFR